MKDDATSSEIWVTKFDQEHAQKFRVQMLAAAQVDPNRPIVVHIDSYGGYVDALASMIETLDELPNPIVTSSMGCAMSCGAILLSHGDVRFLGKHSRVMVHEVSSGTIGNVQDMKADVNETVRLNEYFLGLLAKNCGFKDYSEFRQLIKTQDGTDRYLVGQEAVNFGIVDTIGTPKVTAKVIYEISKQLIKAPYTKPNKQSLIGGRKTKRKSSRSKPKKKSDTRKR